MRLPEKCVLIEVHFRGRDEGEDGPNPREPQKPSKQRLTIARRVVITTCNIHADLRTLKATRQRPVYSGRRGLAELRVQCSQL